MKSFGPIIATAAIAFCGQSSAAAAVCAGPAAAPSAYPSFCSIPPAPKNVRPAEAFRAQVVTTRLAGAVLVRDSSPETWSLAGTGDFTETARREAEPPPPPAALGPAATAAFLAKAKAKAEPPPKPRHRH